MLAFIFDYCVLDGLPIDQSEKYQSLVRFYGEEYAAQFTYEEETVICSHPPPRGDELDDRTPELHIQASA